MRISLVTVCRNAASTIRRTLESADAQRGVELEHIVVDGASDDGTVAELEAFRPLHSRFSFVSEPDRGLYDAINKGIGRATGEVVGLLHADDEFEDAEVLADVARGIEGVDAVYGDLRFVDGEGRSVRYYSSRRWRPWMHRIGFMPAHPTLYVRREVAGRFGGYSTDYEISADFEWMVRVLCRGGVKARYLPRTMVRMRVGGRSTAGAKAMLSLNRENVRAERANGYWSCLAMMAPKYFIKAAGLVRPDADRFPRKEVQR